jgi:uncharacterized protein (DUF2147 family)
MKIKVIILAFYCISSTASAQTSIIGKWKSVDDNTGDPRSIVEIIEREGKIYGKIIKLFPKPEEDPDPVCDKCSPEDARFNKKIIGMEIIKEMSLDDDEYSGGTVLDPEVGKVYRCKVWLEAGKLKVRGYLGPFYRTQTWLKAL